MGSARGRQAKRNSVGQSRARGLGGPDARHFSLETLEDRRLLSADPNAQLLVSPQAQTNVVALGSGVGPAAGSSNPGGFSPSQIAHAYGFDQTSFDNGQIPANGAGQTVAIIEAFHDPTIANDLAAFDQNYFSSFPASYHAYHLMQVSQTGGSATNVPVDSTGSFEVEESLDVEWVHALAPAANILVVEATSAAWSDLFTAINYARGVQGVSVVSMSFGGNEFSGQTANNRDGRLNDPGIVFVASVGDDSTGTYPGFSPYVLAVGGTDLHLDPNTGDITSQSVWNNQYGATGGGYSTVEGEPSYQINAKIPDSFGTRVIPDVAFDADPVTGVPVYDTYNNSPMTPWSEVGGTSLSAPCWAALVADADQGRHLAGLAPYDSTDLLTKLYSLPTDFYDITNGSITNSDGVLNAAPGYDPVSGLGTPMANKIVSDLIGSSSISGTVFNDVNANGTLDNGETGLAGWTVYQDVNQNGTFDAPSVNNFTNNTQTSVAGGTVQSSTAVSGISGDVLDVNVTLNITESVDSDLTLTLIGPNNAQIALATHVGSTSANFTGTTFDDAAGLSINSGLFAKAPFSGGYQPASRLMALNGINPLGTWTLQISSNNSGRTATLTSWSLQITTGDPSTVSSSTGAYQFVNLPSGVVSIGEVLQPTYAQTSPPGGFYSTNLGAGTNVTGENFGDRIPPSSTPTGVVLLATSDTGSLNNDDITNLNNSSPSSELQFQVSGTVSGATIVLYSDSTAIGSAVASGTTTIVTTNGVTTLPDGSHSITATQTSPQQATSGSSPPLAITIETTPPVPAIVSVTPNPSTSPVSQMTITFSEPVSGLDLSDLQLTLNGGGNLLSGQSVSTSDGGVTWTLAGLSAVTSAPGSYELDLVPGGTPITDLAGNVDTTGASSTFTVTAAATVVSRLLFYNQSKYDGNDPSINASDDNAIASDKSAYLAGSGPATFSNISSYTRGINGIMVDITGSHPAITANDFTFQMGNNNSPANWASAPGPSNVTVRAGAGTGGSDRVELVWATGVTEQWLEVTVAANADTGLLTPDVFFFGSAIADDGIGDGTVAAITDPGDVLGARSHPAGSLSNIPVTNLYDYNRDGLVDPGDVLAARNNPTSTLSAAKFLNISSAPAAPSVIPLVAIASGQSTAATVSSTSGARAALASDAPANSSPLSVRNGRFDAALVSGLEIWSAATGLPSGAAAHDVSSLLDDELLSLLASGQRGQRRR